MRYKKILLAFALAGVFLAVAGVGLAANPPSVPWWVSASGGGPAGGGNVAIDSSLGQPVTGPSSAGIFAFGAGYWYGTADEMEVFLPVVKK